MPEKSISDRLDDCEKIQGLQQGELHAHGERIRELEELRERFKRIETLDEDLKRL